MSYKQEFQQNYMDGVKVKISEKYKPPPKISLPVSYSQRLTINKQIQDNLPHYNFALEKTVKERLKEWRTVRSTMTAERRERLDKIRECQDREREEKLRKLEEYENDDDITEKEATSPIVNSLDKVITKDVNFPNYTTVSDVLIPTQVTTTTTDMLVPIPLINTNTGPFICKPIDRSPFNISDFETDTSSPFDNMELKTLNDMEELALVLQKDDEKSNQQTYSYSPSTHRTYAQAYSTFINQSITQPQQYAFQSHLPTSSSYVQPNANGYYLDALQKNAFSSPYDYVDLQTNYNTESELSQLPNESEGVAPKYKTVSDLIKSLQIDLNNVHVNTNNPERPNQFVSTAGVDNDGQVTRDSNAKSEEVELEDPFPNLPTNLQQLSRTVSGMGFPLSRVARVCQLLGNDHKKVIIVCFRCLFVVDVQYYFCS